MAQISHASYHTRTQAKHKLAQQGQPLRTHANKAQHMPSQNRRLLTARKPEALALNLYFVTCPSCTQDSNSNSDKGGILSEGGMLGELVPIGMTFSGGASTSGEACVRVSTCARTRTHALTYVHT